MKTDTFKKLCSLANSLNDGDVVTMRRGHYAQNEFGMPGAVLKKGQQLVFRGRRTLYCLQQATDDYGPSGQWMTEKPEPRSQHECVVENNVLILEDENGQRFAGNATNLTTRVVRLEWHEKRILTRLRRERGESK